MSGSKQLVYIPEIRRNTWLLMSQRLDTVYLREYTRDSETVIEKMDDERARLLLSADLRKT